MGSMKMTADLSFSQNSEKTIPKIEDDTKKEGDPEKENVADLIGKPP